MGRFAGETAYVTTGDEVIYVLSTKTSHCRDHAGRRYRSLPAVEAAVGRTLPGIRIQPQGGVVGPNPGFGFSVLPIGYMSAIGGARLVPRGGTLFHWDGMIIQYLSQRVGFGVIGSDLTQIIKDSGKIADLLGGFQGRASRIGALALYIAKATPLCSA
jgi:hypothetical protein